MAQTFLHGITDTTEFFEKTSSPDSKTKVAITATQSRVLIEGQRPSDEKFSMGNSSLA